MTAVQLTRVEHLATQNGWEIQKNVPLAPYTTFRVGGPADLFITVPDGEAAKELLCACRDSDTPWLLLGNGSNLLIGDEGVRGVTWRFDPHTAVCRLCDDGETVTCGAGTTLTALCHFARANSLSGLEFAFGIPGTVGGAVFMNAGAYDGQIADVVKGATLLTSAGELKTVTAEELALSYRHSRCMETGDIVVDVTLQLKKGDPDAITARMQELMDRRRDKQPLNYPSAGSFFKRPTGYFAGALVEQCGLKGFRVGGAMVSEKHAGFVVNAGGATAKDITDLAREVVRIVFEKTGVTLEPEVRYVGEPIWNLSL